MEREIARLVSELQALATKNDVTLLISVDKNVAPKVFISQVGGVDRVDIVGGVRFVWTKDN